MTTTLITGANKGLGFETTRRLIAAGHTVYVGSTDAERGRRGVPLIRKRTAIMADIKPIMATVKRNELIRRLLAGRCELCEDRTGLQVHHIRKLADLNKPGRPQRPSWMHLMAMRKRKTLVVCQTCHQNIHAGQITATTRK
jgi:NADP-dependent 3-hydroxy acid dehydrogenase YdfG